MASIKDLLNPLPEERPPAQSSGIRSSGPINLSTAARGGRTVREKRVRMPKDAALYRLGKPKGEVRYPPFETCDEDILKIHREFQMYPMGKITEYPRHIPYQSDKKSFQEKTGRDSFNGIHFTHAP